MLEIYEFLSQLVHTMFGSGTSRVSVIYIPTTILIAYIVYVRAHGANVLAFWRYFAPIEVYGHASHILDIKLMTLGAALRVLGIMSSTALNTLGAVTTMILLRSLTGWEGAEIEWTTGRFIVLTLLFALLNDFCTYWVHRIHHENQLLWPLHKVHHSAEVMTPITLYRKHPLFDAIANVARTLVVGAITGFILFLFVGKIDYWTIAGANGIYFFFNMLGGNLRHSHVWVGFGPVFSRIFISPAMHQIHHSRLKHHYNSNYGEVFALWDWIFGTIYIPKQKEAIEFGLSDEHGNRIEQPHDSLRNALIVPLREIGEEISKLRAQWRQA